MREKIFGQVRVGDDYRIRTNRELYELLIWTFLSELIISGYVRMDEDAPPRRVFDAVVRGHRTR